MITPKPISGITQYPIICGVQIAKPVFACCGAMEMCGMGASSYLPKLEHARQDFMTAFLRYVGITSTHYFICTDSQVAQMKDDRDCVFKFLLELGAKKVDDTPNQVHGPAHMDLYVWAPNLNKDKILNYVSVGGGGYGSNPLWWEALTDADRTAIKAKYPPLTDAQQHALWIKEAAEKKAADIAIQRKKLEYIKAYYPELIGECGLQTKATKVVDNKVITHVIDSNQYGIQEAGNFGLGTADQNVNQVGGGADQRRSVRSLPGNWMEASQPFPRDSAEVRQGGLWRNY
jgi:hypothetical protein